MALLAIAPIPVLALVLFFYKFNEQKEEFQQVTSSFLKRQNRVIAFDAIQASQGFTAIFATAAKDLRNMALLPPNTGQLKRFYQANRGPHKYYDEKRKRIVTQSIPIYNSIAVLDHRGNFLVHLDDGDANQSIKTLSDCQQAPLCDDQLIQRLLRSPQEDPLKGRLLRWYTPKTQEEIIKGATWRVGIKTSRYIYILGIDFRRFKTILFQPTFPYSEKQELLDAYQEGEYIYYFDHQGFITLHPKHWHVPGIDPKTKNFVAPAVQDSQIGRAPLNFNTYKGQRLKIYFDRLKNISTKQKTVDIFRAANLSTLRVMAVAPLISKSFKHDHFGWAVTGCRVDNFEEPQSEVFPIE